MSAPRPALAVDIVGALNLVGSLLKYFSLAFLFPTAIALGYEEPFWPFLAAGAITAAVGLALEFGTSGKEEVGAREGFLVVSLVWILVPAFGALPYLFSGEDQFSRPVDAYFEAMSGFSTTGSSVMTDIEGIAHSLAMWRQFTVWVGGMGIIVLALAVLPRLRVGGRQLFLAESPGPEIEPLTATIREAARRFLLLYVGLTAAAIGVLIVLGLTGIDDRMGPYEAVAHAFATLATGGFSTRARSLEEFGAATQWAVAGFMVLAATNFALMYRAIVIRRLRPFARDEEFRLYLTLLGLASVLVLIELLTEDIASGEAAVRHAFFQTASMMSTTGFASTDFNEWTPLTGMTLIGLMLIGGSAGSTSGSIKTARHVVIGKMLRRELDQTVHPELVAPLQFNGRPVEEKVLRAVIVFVLLYLGIAGAGALGVLVDSSLAGVELGTFEAVAAAATTLGGVGPGLGFAGPMGSFEPFSDLSTIVLSALMWLGRIEIIPAVVLLTRSYWRA